MALNYNARIYEDAAVAALSIVTKVFNLIQSVVIGFGQGFQPVLGYNYGARRLDRVKEAVWFSVRTCTVILTIAAVTGYVLAPHVIALFRRDDALVIAIGTRAFRHQCLTLPLGAVLVFANMFFQSLGKSWRAVMLAICRQGLYIPLVFFMAGRAGLAGLEWTQAVCDLLAFAFSASVILLYFKREFGREGS